MSKQPTDSLAEDHLTMTTRKAPHEEPPAPTVPEQATPAGSPDPPGPAPDSTTVLDPGNRVMMASALQDAMRELNIRSRRFNPGGDREYFAVLANAEGLNQMVTLRPDTDRPGRWAWHWIWNEGLRGEASMTTERFCAGEDIVTASTKIARVLGVLPVAV